MALYSEKLLDHAKYPRKFGRIAEPDIRFEEYNPLCGDRIRVELRVAPSGEVIEARFSGEMCAIATGSASILFESLEGKAADSISAISDVEVLENLAGAVPKNRIQCALLPIAALRVAVRAEDRGAALT